MDQLGSHTTGFHDIWYLSIFPKSVEKIQVSLKSDKNSGHFIYLVTYVHFWPCLGHFALEWEMFRTKVVEKIKTHILCSVTHFRKSRCLWDNVEKYCRAGQATDDNITRRMGIAGYKNTLRMCNTYCFSTATVVARTFLHVTLYARLSCLVFFICSIKYSSRFWHTYVYCSGLCFLSHHAYNWVWCSLMEFITNSFIARHNTAGTPKSRSHAPFCYAECCVYVLRCIRKVWSDMCITGPCWRFLKHRILLEAPGVCDHFEIDLLPASE